MLRMLRAKEETRKQAESGQFVESVVTSTSNSATLIW